MSHPAAEAKAQPPHRDMQQNLTRNTLHGIGLSMGAAVMLGGMQVVTTSLVARRVAPQVFGFLAMAQIVIKLAAYFSQFGVGSALIQKDELSASDIAAAQVLAIGSGILFAFGIFALAPFASAIFHTTEVVWVIRALSVSFLLSSLTVTPMGLLRRHLNFGIVSGIEIASYAIGFSLPCLALVFAGRGLLGLIAGSLGSYVVQIVLLLMFQPIYWGVARRWHTYRCLLSYGSKISVIGFLEYVNSSVDVFAVGRYLGAAPLGLYTRAANVASVPLSMATSAVSRVLFPALSRVQNDPAKLAKAYLDSLTLTLLLTCPLGFAMIPAAGHIVHFLLGPRWSDAVPPLRVFAAMVPFNMAVSLPGTVLDATGTLLKKLYVRAVTLFLAAVLVYLFRYAGIVAIAWIMFACFAVTFGGYHALVVRQLGIRLSAALTPVLLGCWAGLLSYALIRAATWAVSAGLFPMLAIEASLLLVAYVLILVVSPFPSVNRILSRIFAGLSSRARAMPSPYRSRCLARQIAFTLRPAYERGNL
jgi:lipopolysaccharide exporter